MKDRKRKIEEEEGDYDFYEMVRFGHLGMWEVHSWCRNI